MRPAGTVRLASVLMLGVIAGCGAGSGGSAAAPGVVPVPASSWRPGDISLLALARGTLEGGQRGGRYCVWLSTWTGPHPVVWPAGYHLRRHPLELLGPGDVVVARGGDQVTFSGGGLPVSPGRACMLGQGNALYVMSRVSVVRR
jgi:hypothetical protein